MLVFISFIGCSADAVRNKPFRKHSTSIQAADDVSSQVSTSTPLSTGDSVTQETTHSDSPPKLELQNVLASVEQIEAHIDRGAQDVSHVNDKVVPLFMGGPGAGKSTTINALLGHELKQVSSRSLGLDGQRRPVIVVDSSSRSTNTSIMEIGHGEESRTFLPVLVQTPGNEEMFYCDCPGFLDNRGAEINIANAINIRSVLQQAKGVKAVFLVPYQDLYAQRGANVRSLNAICKQMFGSEANLRNHLDSVLLGVTGAPLTDEFGNSTQRNEIREDIQKIRRGSSGSAVHALAERIFLFDPLDRAGDNRDFWSMNRFREEISELKAIPRDEATSIFAVPLTDSDSSHLYGLADCLQRSIISALKRKDHTALGQHWQSLQRLCIIEHENVEGLITNKVTPAINVVMLKMIRKMKDNANQRSFEAAWSQLDELTSVVKQLPGLGEEFGIDELRTHIEACENTKDPKVLEANMKKLENYTQELEARLRDATAAP